MGQFFKFLLASCLGVILAMVAISGISFLILAGIASSAQKPKKVSPNTVLKLTFDDPIPDLTNNVAASPFTADFNEESILGLHAIVDAIERAKEDDNIKGIYIEPSLNFSAGFTTARTIREAIEDFKESGKFVVAHSKFYTQGMYYVCSAADEVYANPMGYFDLRGFASMRAFYKDMLDRLGVKMQIFYAGKYKSGSEPYRRNEMSPESKEQLREIMGDLYGVFLEDISNSRKMDQAELKHVVDNLLANTPKNAEKHGLIDQLLFPDEVQGILREKLGLDEDEKVKTIGLSAYNDSNPASSDYSVRNRIAVVHAEGVIIDGKGENGSTGDLKYIKIINDLADNDKVKAVVLRVNSPGGSALASENIWHALTQLKEEGKPLVVSMGDYAASGGYYIACIGDSIFAEPNTLTGSIGVYSTLPAIGGALESKLGVHYDSVKTGKFAAGLNLIFEMGPEETRKMQQSTEEAYATFLQRVADGRDMDVEDVHKIAQGRVWTGQRALKNGLVDGIGGLDEAVRAASKMAGLEEYRVTHYPKVKDPFQQLIDELLNPDPSVRTARMIKEQFPELYPHYKMIREVQSAKGPQARADFYIPFE